MERTLISSLHQFIEQSVVINGWISVKRDHGKITFLVIHDRTGDIQTVALSNHPEVLAIAQSLREQTPVRAEGVVHKRPEKMVKADEDNGDIELELTALEAVGTAEELPFALESAELNIDTLLDWRPLTLRRERERAIFKVQAEIVKGYREFLIQEGFTEFQAPKLIGDDAEGSGEVFELEYFNEKKAHLATSPQLYKQIMVGVFERVFTTGNVYRAEKHSTTRHLNEYTSLDIECGFITDHTDLMKLETKLMRFLFTRLQEKCTAEFTLLGATFPLIPEGDSFPYMKLREAQQLIKEKTGEDRTNDPDLEPQDERWLCQYAHDELGSDFIFVTHYPLSKRPFYTAEDENDKGFTKSFDCLFRGVEITTGGQRVHEASVLIEKAKAKGLDPQNFSFYLQAFKFGMPPHGGWGMGLERLTQKFLGLENVKEATLFPRDINRIDTLLSQ